MSNHECCCFQNLDKTQFFRYLVGLHPEKMKVLRTSLLLTTNRILLIIMIQEGVRWQMRACCAPREGGKEWGSQFVTALHGTREKKKEQEDVWGLLKESSSKTFCHQNFPGRSQSVLSFPCLQLGKRNNTALLKSVGTGECLAFDLKWSSMALKYSGHAVNLFGGGKNYGSHSEKRWQKEQTL